MASVTQHPAGPASGEPCQGLAPLPPTAPLAAREPKRPQGTSRLLFYCQLGPVPWGTGLIVSPLPPPGSGDTGAPGCEVTGPRRIHLQPHPLQETESQRQMTAAGGRTECPFSLHWSQADPTWRPPPPPGPSLSMSLTETMAQDKSEGNVEDCLLLGLLGQQATRAYPGHPPWPALEEFPYLDSTAPT